MCVSSRLGRVGGRHVRRTCRGSDFPGRRWKIFIKVADAVGLLGDGFTSTSTCIVPLLFSYSTIYDAIRTRTFFTCRCEHIASYCDAGAEIRRLDLVLLQYGLGNAALVLLATGAMFACAPCGVGGSK